MTFNLCSKKAIGWFKPWKFDLKSSQEFKFPI